MKTLARTTALFVVMALLAGCTPMTHEAESDIPPATISAAAFRVGEGYTVKITGEFFKIKSNNKSDVIVSLNGRNWFPSTSISDSSPTTYTAVLPYGISFPQVWVRVFGMNGKYSEPYMVQGWMR